MMRLAIILAVLIASTCQAKDSKTKFAVRAVSHDSQVNQRTSTYKTPGTTDTNCSGSATTLGNTTSGTANCQTTSTLARTHQFTISTLDVTNAVQANGMRYVIVCRASWSGSNCGPLTDGDMFPAEIEGTTMWIEARKGGNQGKKIRIKYKILDIRPTTNSQTVESVPVVQRRQTEVGNPLDNAGVIEMMRTGLKEDTIIYVIGIRPSHYSLSQTDRAALRAAGVSEAIIQAMAEKLAG